MPATISRITRDRRFLLLNLAIQFLAFAMLCEKFIEQYRVDLLVANWFRLSLRIAPTRSACTSAICSAIEGVQYHPTAAFPMPVVRLNAVPPFCHFDPG